MKPTKPIRQLLLASALLAAPIVHAQDQDGTWITDGDGNWTDAINWADEEIANGSGFTAFFTAELTGDRVVSLNGNRTIGNITFTDGTTSAHDLSITGNTLTLAGTTPTLSVTQADRTLTISSVIAGIDGLTKTGPGDLLLNTANNTYTGGTTISEGRLIHSRGGTVPLGDSSGDASIAENAALRLNNTGTGNFTVTNKITGSGTIEISSNSAPTGSNQRRTLLDNTDIDDFTGDIHVLQNGNFAAWTGGGATLAMHNLSGRTVTIDSGGFMTLAGNANFPNTTTTIGSLFGSGTVTRNFTTVASITTLVVSEGNFSGTINPDALDSDASAFLALTKVDEGTLILSGNNTYTGATTINGGVLQIGNGGNTGTLGTNSNTFIASGAELRINRTDTFGYQYTGALTGSGTVNVVSGARFDLTNNSQTDSGDLSFNLDGALALRNVAEVHLGELTGSGTIARGGTANNPTTIVIGGKGTDATFDGTITTNTTQNTANNFSVEKTGAGILTLAGENTYGGNTTINEGTLVLDEGGTLSFIIAANEQSNRVTGEGTAELNGTFSLNLTAADVSHGNSWLLADADTKTFGAEFMVTSTLGAFTRSGQNHIRVDGANIWTFSEATGMLTLAISSSGSDYDAWAALFPDADLSDPDADFDGDGLTNDQERLFGLDPTDPASINPIVVPLDAATGTLSFTRRDPTLTGAIYRVWVSTDLMDWQVDQGAVLAPGALVDDVETVSVEISEDLLDEPRLFIRIEAAPPGSLLDVDFEDDDGGFTVSTASGTAWEWGAPDSPDQGGGAVTSGSNGTLRCWGTNLTGGYGPDTDTSLRSPVIDLTDVTSATLSFWKAIDADFGHNLTVNVIEADTDTVIANIIPATGDDDIFDAVWQPVGPVTLPAEAYGQPVRIEWRFTGNGAFQFNGVYLDNVLLLNTAP